MGPIGQHGAHCLIGPHFGQEPPNDLRGWVIENLRALAVFAKTAELGSFRAAARALELSPSVVSHHVSELERRLARTLLYRTTRHLGAG